MSKRSVLEIIVVGFGLYCIFTAIQRLPELWIYFWWKPGLEGLRIGYSIFRLFVVLFPVFSFLIGFLLIIKTRAIASFLDSRTTPTSPAESDKGGCKLSFWITLIGFYYLIPATATVLSTIIAAFNQDGSDVVSALMNSGMTSWSQFFIFFFSIVIIFQSGKIEAFILRKTDRKTLPPTDEEGQGSM
jgi:hypothetical protein